MCGNLFPDKVLYHSLYLGMPDPSQIYMQAQTFWIERTFQDDKTKCGLGEYQARKWLSWHHHMAMVMITMLFKQLNFIDIIIG